MHGLGTGRVGAAAWQRTHQAICVLRHAGSWGDMANTTLDLLPALCVGCCKNHRSQQDQLRSASGPQNPMFHSRDIAAHACSIGQTPNVQPHKLRFISYRECTTLRKGRAGATSWQQAQRAQFVGWVGWADFFGQCSFRIGLVEGSFQHRYNSICLQTAPEESPTSTQ